MPRNKLESLTEPMYYTLIALKQPRCGIEITDFVLTITHHRVKLGPGTLYTMLSKFMDEQMIDEVAVDGRKRTYLINEKGLTMLKSEYERLTTMLEEGAPYMQDNDSSPQQ